MSVNVRITAVTVIWVSRTGWILVNAKALGKWYNGSIPNASNNNNIESSRYHEQKQL